jgi:CRISPR-associated Cas5-like protein
MKLDAKTVVALRLDGKTDAIHFDSELPGFGLRLRRGVGGKLNRSWVVQYRRAGSTRRLLLGSADVLSAAQAREAARKALAKVQLGHDPQAQRSERRDRDRVQLRSVVEEYLDLVGKKLRAKTLYDNRRYLCGSYFKPLHEMPLDRITRRDVAARLVAITRAHSPAVATAARAKLGAFFTWAMQMGLVDSNPIIGTPKPERIVARERTLSDAELAAYYNALPADSEYGRMVRLLILLGARRQEIGGMAESELNVEAGSWTKPASRTKNKRSHTLPLPSAALAIIRAVPRMVGRDQLFGIRAAQGFSNFNRVKAALDARSGVVNARLHDIRRTLSTRLHDLGTPPHVVEEILAHRAHRAGSAGAYNWSDYRDEVRAALEKWQRYVLMIADADLRAAHKRFVERGDEKERKANRKTFIDAISKGDARWARYLAMLRGDEAANVVHIPRKGA